MGEQKVLFIQGGGNDGYDADKLLVASLKSCLGNEYQISYPKIHSDEKSSDYGWTKQIGENISILKQDFILVGHSFGASMILKYLSENSANKFIKGVFLAATPFWNGNEEWQKGLKLVDNFAAKLPIQVPFFFYHCLDDEEISFSHFEHYKQKLKKATFRTIENGGHQLNNDLTLIAKDIKSSIKKYYNRRANKNNH